MAKIVRHEFLGSRLWFWFQCMTVIGLPLAVLYLLDATVQIEEEVEDVDALLAPFRKGPWPWS